MWVKYGPSFWASLWASTASRRVVCFVWRRDSSPESDHDFLLLIYFQRKKENSNSTVDVPKNTVAMPPQNSCMLANRIVRCPQTVSKSAESLKPASVWKRSFSLQKAFKKWFRSRRLTSTTRVQRHAWKVLRNTWPWEGSWLAVLWLGYEEERAISRTRMCRPLYHYCPQHAGLKSLLLQDKLGRMLFQYLASKLSIRSQYL